MAGCVLRVSLPSNGDLESALRALRAEPLAVFRKGQPRTPGGSRISDVDAFNLLVSDHDGDSVDQQVVDADAFLAHHQQGLLRLAHEHRALMVLDFGTFLPDDAMMRTHRLPAPLLARCAELGIGVDVSVYRSSTTDD